MGLYSMHQCSALGSRIEAIGNSQDTVAKAVGTMKRSAGAHDRRAPRPRHRWGAEKPRRV